MTRDLDLEGLLKQAEALRAQSDALLLAAKSLEKEVRRLAARQPKNGHPEALGRSTGKIQRPKEPGTRCPERESGGVQCVLLRGHSGAHDVGEQVRDARHARLYDIHTSDFDDDEVPF